MTGPGQSQTCSHPINAQMLTQESTRRSGLRLKQLAEYSD